MIVGWAPELYESLSRDFERRISSPAWKKATPCESATSADASQQRRMRVSMLSSSADFMIICAAPQP